MKHCSPPPVQMRAREVKLWDRRVLNSSIGSQSLGTSNGWVLRPQPSGTLALTHIARQCLTVRGWKVASQAHAFCVRCVSTAGGCLLSFLVDPAEVLTLSLHNSRVRDTCSVSVPGEKKRPQVNRLHHTSIMGAQGQAAVSTSTRLSSVLLLVVLCSWPFLLRLFFQTRLPKGQWKAEARLSQVRRGIEGWKWNKGGRSELSFRSLCIFNTLDDSHPALSADVGWFRTMWRIKLFLFHYFHQPVSPRSTLSRFSCSRIKICRQIFHRQVFGSPIPGWFTARTQKRDHKQRHHL